MATRERCHKWRCGASSLRAKDDLEHLVHFNPNGGGFDMKVVESKPREVVKWKCTGVEFMHHCSTKWGTGD